MSLSQWGAVIDMGGTGTSTPVVSRNAKRWRIGSERKTLREWADDPRNTLKLTTRNIQCRIWRAEQKGRLMTIRDLQDPKEKYSHRSQR